MNRQTPKLFLKLKTKLFKTDSENLQDDNNESQIFVVDRVLENIIICENLDTEEIVKFDIKKAPLNTVEGNILMLKNDTLVYNDEKTIQRKVEIERMLDDLWE